MRYIDTHTTLYYICLVLVVVGGVCAMVKCEKERQRRNDAYWEERQERVEREKREMDSLQKVWARLDSMVRARDSVWEAEGRKGGKAKSNVQRQGQQAKKARSSSRNRAREEEDYEGTSPDDGMFGFDYWDDRDDRYHDERNETDPYPNEEDW